MKKIGIYTPYLDSFGGGERYILTAAEILSSTHQVELLLDSHQISLTPQTLIADLEVHLNLNLQNVNLVEMPTGRGINFIRRLFFFKKYDVVIYLTDGSIFFCTAKKNIIHFQVPFKNTKAQDIWGKIKASTWDLAICNSKFTEKYVKKDWPIKTTVIYPPVDITKIKPLKKKKYILSVGRFVSFTKAKKHEEMIKIFSKMHTDGKIDDWSLHLAGSVEGDDKYIDELKRLAGDNPIFFYPNLPFEKLVILYGQSKIYWHAAGFGEDDPTKMEHFGITTVEAMAGGCVPVAINKGGQPEIIENGKSGFLWKRLEDLQSQTINLMKDGRLWSKLSANALYRSKLFSTKIFQENLENLMKKV